MLQSSISVRFARTLAGIAAASLLAGVISTGAAQAGKNEFPERLPGSGHRPKDDAELDPIDVSYVWLREMQRHFEPGGFRLGMYGTPGASSDGWAGAQFSTTRNNGYGLTDTAGLLPAGLARRASAPSPAAEALPRPSISPAISICLPMSSCFSVARSTRARPRQAMAAPRTCSLPESSKRARCGRTTIG
jgi:hypothetical protein